MISALPGASWRQAAGQASGATTDGRRRQGRAGQRGAEGDDPARLGRPVVARDPQPGHHPARRVADDVHRRRARRQRRVDGGVEHRDLGGEVAGAVTDERQHRRGAARWPRSGRRAAATLCGSRRSRARAAPGRAGPARAARPGRRRAPRVRSSRAPTTTARRPAAPPPSTATSSRRRGLTGHARASGVDAGPGHRTSRPCDAAASASRRARRVRTACRRASGGQDGPARGQRRRVEQAVRGRAGRRRAAGVVEQVQRQAPTPGAAAASPARSRRSASVSSSRPASGDSPAASSGRVAGRVLHVPPPRARQVRVRARAQRPTSRRRASSRGCAGSAPPRRRRPVRHLVPVADPPPTAARRSARSGRRARRRRARAARRARTRRASAVPSSTISAYAETWSTPAAERRRRASAAGRRRSPPACRRSGRG